MRPTPLLSLASVAAVALASAAAGVAVADAAASPPPPIHEVFTPLPCTGSPANRTTIQLEGCAEQKILQSDKTIDTLNGEIFTALKSTSGGQTRFVAANTAWLKYRNAYCLAAASQFAGGTLAPVADANCTVTLNKQHVANLKIFLDDLTNE
jgi:uncharacterized protein YecT (DUF1311 family)